MIAGPTKNAPLSRHEAACEGVTSTWIPAGEGVAEHGAGRAANPNVIPAKEAVAKVQAAAPPPPNVIPAKAGIPTMSRRAKSDRDGVAKVHAGKLEQEPELVSKLLRKRVGPLLRQPLSRE